MKSWLLMALLGISSLAAENPTVQFRSTENRVHLLELYTSEGCSSCPPAGEWITKLKQTKGLWREVVPVEFHVDYWDELGWRDPWASKAWTERQKDYAEAWRAENIYTPGFVLDGREWRDWSGSNYRFPTDTIKVGVLEATATGTNLWQIKFTPTAAIKDPLEVHVALLGFDLSSDVKRGENRGRKLIHDFVVLKNATIPLQAEAGIWSGKVSFGTNVKPGERMAFAAWVSPRKRPAPLQAVGGWLSQP